MLKGWGLGDGGVIVAHEILVTAPEAKFPSPLLDLTRTWTWPRYSEILDQVELVQGIIQEAVFGV